MKWLIFFLLYSCGGHKSPQALDLFDQDGDQILNYLESSEENKYVANFEPLGPIKGMLRVNHTTPLEVKFANRVNFREDALKLMAGKENDISYREYFSEWSEVSLEKKMELDLKQKLYTLHLHFESTGTKPEEVWLVHKEERILIGMWQPSMRVDMTPDNLSLLLSGEAVLAFGKKFQNIKQYPVSADESIKFKTYRVYLYDGKVSRVFYVSKDLSFEDFKKLRNINELHEYKMDDIFFSQDFPREERWFERSFENGDKALVFAREEDLRTILLQRFHYQKQILSRVNGIPQSAMVLEAGPGAVVYLKMHALHKTERTFQEKTIHKEYRVGSLAREGYKFSCRHQIREIAEEKNIMPFLEDFFNNVEFSGGQIDRVEEYALDGQFSWEMRLTAEGLTQLKFRPKAVETFVITGEYGPKCRDAGRDITLVLPEQTNREGKLSFEIESYIEKNQ